MSATRWMLTLAPAGIVLTLRHPLPATVRGGFMRATGVLEFDPKRPEHSAVELELDPGVRFRSVAWESLGDPMFRVRGDLTMRGITRRVVLVAEHRRLGRTARWSARISIDRRDFNIALPTAGELAEVRIELLATVAAAAQAA